MRARNATMIRRLTDTMVEIEGEALRTRDVGSSLRRSKSGDWGIAGNPLTTGRRQSARCRATCRITLPFGLTRMYDVVVVGARCAGSGRSRRSWRGAGTVWHSLTEQRSPATPSPVTSCGPRALHDLHLGPSRPSENRGVGNLSRRLTFDFGVRCAHWSRPCGSGSE